MTNTPHNNTERPDFERMLHMLAELERKYREKHKDVYSPEFSEDFTEMMTDLRDEVETIWNEYEYEMRKAGTDLQDMLTRIKQLQNKLVEMKHILESPVFEFATYIEFVEDHKNASGENTGYSVVDIYAPNGRMVRTVMHEDIDPDEVRYGQKVLLKENVVAKILDEFKLVGEEATVSAVLEPDKEGARVLLSTGFAEHKIVAHLSENVDVQDIEEGSSVLVDGNLGLITEVLPEKESQEYLIGEIPKETFDDVGGLSDLTEQIINDVALPFTHPDEVAEIEFERPKGILLYGPPGTGKTLIAKATANLLRDKVQEIYGEEAQARFYHIAGPEILNKWVGNSEEKIRELFKTARENSSELNPAVIFIDEADAILSSRGSGISSDMETTIVPQFTTMIDGLEESGNILLILASNRPERLDAAITRPGRVDNKYHIDRPDKEGARDVFSKYLTPRWGIINRKYDVPVYTPRDSRGKPRTDAEGRELKVRFEGKPEKVAEYLIDAAVELMYSERKILQLEYTDGTSEVLKYGDFASGAMIENIVSQAKKLALINYVKGEREYNGIEKVDLLDAVDYVFAELRAPVSKEEVVRWLDIEGMLKKRLADYKFLGIDEESDEDEEEEL